MNEMKLSFKRGQRIRFYDRFGNIKTGTYVMASSQEGYVVLNMGGKHGTPYVCNINSIIPAK